MRVPRSFYEHVVWLVGGEVYESSSCLLEPGIHFLILCPFDANSTYSESSEASLSGLLGYSLWAEHCAPIDGAPTRPDLLPPELGSDWVIKKLTRFLISFHSAAGGGAAGGLS